MNAGDMSTGERIIHAALSLIASEGLGAVTMRSIAETAGVARQTLYNHYSDVDSIVVAAIARHSEESIRLLESSLATVARPEESIEQLVRHVIAVGAHNHHSPGIAHGLSATAREALGGYDNAVESCIRRVLEEGQTSGVFRRDLDLGIDVDLVGRMLDGLSDQAARDPEAAPTLAATGLRTILAAIGV